MTIRVEVHSSDLIEKMSKEKKPYFLQTAYAWTTEKDGEPKRYPEEIQFFSPKDQQGKNNPYPPGNYIVSDQSFRVGAFNRLELGFLVLEPSEV
jgi:hypothetical protein